jgi:hypothetical protein
MPIALAIVLGYAAVAMGAVVTVVLPELGIPLLLVGLRLLGRRYAWARSANRKIDAGWGATKAWYHRQHVVLRAAIVAALLGLAILIGWLTLNHI